MRRFSLFGTIFVIIVFVSGMVWLGLRLIGRSFVPDGLHEGSVPGLSAEATITRDQYGIPYIEAASQDDAWAALGYAHAQDRLWQMDLMRRAGEGRLSEIFGRSTIGYDAMLKTIGFARTSRQILKTMPARTRHALDAYCRGVNAFISTHKSRYPFEFDALGYQPEPWKPEHSVMLTRLMAWELNTSFWTDVVFGEIQARVDSAKLAEILPYYPSDAPTIIPGGQHPEPLLEQMRNPVLPQDTVHRDSVAKSDTAHRVAMRGRSSDLSDVMALEGRMRKFLGIDGSHIGSNAWAVSGSRTASGLPMLANDPHLTHTAPCRWYQVVIVTKESRLAGVTIPGCPFVVIGRNQDVAWGITSMMADETDFYVERPDSANKKAVMRDGRPEKLTVLRDTIAVKDSASVPMVIRLSRHGPIISDVHPFAADAAKGRLGLPDTTAYLSRSMLAMRWRGNDVSQELAAWQGINDAHNLKQFTAAARLGGIPSISFVYADRGGTIAYVPTVRVPIREGSHANLPLPGWDSRYDWKGTVPMDKLPMLVDPPGGFIASANNKVANNLGYNIGDLWEDPSRAIRLNELLKEGNNYGAMDFVQIQGDVGSPHMRYMTEFLLRAFPDSAKQPPLIRMALHRLRSWDGRMIADAPEASIAAVWLQTVIEMTYRDEMGPTVFSHYVRMAQLPIKAIRYHVMTNSRWFDDVTTPGVVERRDDILRHALGRALDSLHGRFGTWDMERWRYGAIHTLTFPHPFDKQEKLKPIVDIGPYEIGGSNTTLNNGEWSFNEPYQAVVGPSMREIVDFGDSTTFLRSVITSGASGQPLNQFYKNQTVLWLANGYLSLKAATPMGSAVSSVTRLVPADGN